MVRGIQAMGEGNRKQWKKKTFAAETALSVIKVAVQACFLERKSRRAKRLRKFISGNEYCAKRGLLSIKAK